MDAEDDDFPANEEGAESTVAMTSPAFEGVPSPISVPPPAPRKPVPMGTSPVAFPPPAPTPQPSSPRVARPEPAPAPAPRAQRAQTVIGIAPPAPGAQRPPTAPVPMPVPTPRAAKVQSEFAPDLPRLDPGQEEHTMTGIDALFALDGGASAAARAAVRPAAGRPSSAAQDAVTVARSRFDKEAPTLALDRGDIALGGIPNLGDRSDEDESTRAVPREELLRGSGQDAQLVVGDDAQGDDATLAVAPGTDEASLKRRAAFAETLTSEVAFPPPAAAFPSMAGRPTPSGTMQSTQALGPAAPSAPMPAAPWDPNQGSWGPGMAPPMPQPHAAPLSGQMPVAPMPNPHGGMMPNAYPNPAPWGPMPGPPAKAFPLSGQMILLIVIGVVCIGIFVTGIVLFVTTKF